ncbi:unnamed protein product [Schistocephalus solidus]|uniref:Uncharacterized protein n=1 Tax=Schistocephalus solidus TaxID=70667 RepID=A0A183SCC3_SCHSO|nr:unnamed protein product [Schistocephalus solidus]
MLEPPREPGRPGVIEAGAKEAIVAWASGNNDCCEDLVYKLDVKFPDPNVQCSSVSSDERAWMLCWRQSTHPFGLSDHPEALLTRPLTASSAFVFENPPAPNALLELQQFHGLVASIESIRALCSLEGLISR